MGGLYNKLEPKGEEYKELIEDHPFINKIGGFNGTTYYIDYK